jgi:hypothetical protein
MHSLFRLHEKYKWIGYALLLLSIISYWGFSYFNYRIEVPVFAVVSSFIETQYFIISRTSITEELPLLMALIGFFCIVFSKEKDESTSHIAIRSESLLLAFLANTVFMVASVIFLYGSSFIVALVINIFSPFIFYLVIFQIKLRKWRKINRIQTT